MSSLTPTAEEVYKTFRKLMVGGTSRYPIGNWGDFQEGIDELLDEGILEFIERDNGLVSYYRFTEDIINTILQELINDRDRH